VALSRGLPLASSAEKTQGIVAHGNPYRLDLRGHEHDHDWRGDMLPHYLGRLT
jgi:hypothetical protein